MRILIADRLAESVVERLRAGGDMCEVNPTLNAASLPEHIDDFDVLVVRSTKVTAATLNANNSLGMILRAGAGTNNIDTKRAGELGIFVCNVPGRNAIAVAELTIGLMFAIDRHIAPATAELRVGDWNKQTYSKARGLFGSTLGIIGMGAIGLHVAQRAKACGLRIIAVTNPARSQTTRTQMADIGVEEVANRDMLLGASDIVSVHVPAETDTNQMVDAKFLAAMKNDAVLINTSRGDLIDEDALLAALDSTDLRAGLDVFASEPSSGTGKFISKLAQHPKVTATHHIGASTEQAQAAIAEGTAEVIEAYRRGDVLNCVNLEAIPKGTATLSIRHYNRVGVLASVLREMSSRGLNVANMQNRILAGSKAAVAVIEVTGSIDDELLGLLGALDNVICVALQDARTPAASQ
ncbi:MAG: hydroxyacid dehydrogenase [Acidimicrobiia bacterium]|nr:hydroxyacid dehydrogenase [Acidimicrobiia bacterium]MYC58158.1 hydroxyacid dehydrogenase [Acidimicrobiia bacterium]MYG94355.1 hydroxyacid dehydrogenase [Acidimicrobiia bacterium]MYI30590.1 hydroxyacid dehydrogenase [Acidimicrobiia bacterium]